MPERALCWEGQRPKSCFRVGTEPLPLALPLSGDEQGWLAEEAGDMQQ